MSDRARVLMFLLVSALCLAGAFGYMRFAALRPATPPVRAGDLTVEWIDGASPEPPYWLFRSTLAGTSFGRVGYVPIHEMDGPRYLTPISCDRLYFRAGHGVCLTVENDRRFPANAYLFDTGFRLGPPVRLTGPPSRTRVSPDGRLAAITVFESGHSYADAGFSMRTSLIDTEGGGRIIADLEQFDVRRNGASFKPVDSNFWGVTFLLEGRDFYATVSS
jgi:hypothetical protein